MPDLIWQENSKIIMMEIEDINIGYKLEYLIPAFFIILTGGLMFFANLIPAIIAITFGIVLLCMRSGIEVDIKNKKIRKYGALANLKFGFWTDLINLPMLNLNIQMNRKQ